MVEKYPVWGTRNLGRRAHPSGRGTLVSNVRRMDQRTLARTGVHVSPLCLGAMMFGAWGETDHDACIRIIHRALDAGINSQPVV